MDILDPGTTLKGQVDTLKRVWRNYDFFFLHYKYTDSTGEDGNFPAKVQMIEKLDGIIPDIQALKPDVFIVTGDHSTPSKMQSHSWHPVPTLISATTIGYFRARPENEFESRKPRGAPSPAITMR